jgi:hypothetical protein
LLKGADLYGATKDFEDEPNPLTSGREDRGAEASLDGMPLQISRYTVQRVPGSGGFGIVYLAHSEMSLLYCVQVY